MARSRCDCLKSIDKQQVDRCGCFPLIRLSAPFLRRRGGEKAANFGSFIHTSSACRIIPLTRLSGKAGLDRPVRYRRGRLRSVRINGTGVAAGNSASRERDRHGSLKWRAQMLSSPDRVTSPRRPVSSARMLLRERSRHPTTGNKGLIRSWPPVGHHQVPARQGVWSCHTLITPEAGPCALFPTSRRPPS